MEYKVSRHAQERYAERIMGRDNATDMNLFISNHITKINEDLSKMIEFGNLIYEGRSLKGEWNKAVVQIYLKDQWTLIYDKDRNNIVTVYKIDLGVGDEMNELYISKLLNSLEEAKTEYEEKCIEIDKRQEQMEDLMKENEEEINHYRSIINALMKQNDGYNDIINELQASKTAAEEKVRSIVGTLVAKNIF